MAEVASLLLSPFLQAFFERMASHEFADIFRGRKLDEGLLRNLKIQLLSVSALLEDVEENQLTKPAVKAWLEELKDVVYEAEDVLDEIATKALQRKLDAELQTTSSKVGKSISNFFGHFVKGIEPKIKELLADLKYLADQKDFLGLKEGVGGESSKRLPTTSLVEESDIFGRDDDKEKIINLLLDDATSNENLCVIPIVGMGGIGKTALAQLVYKDQRVKEHFDLQAWVCVSDEFDVFRATKAVLEGVGSSISVDSKNLKLLVLEGVSLSTSDDSENLKLLLLEGVGSLTSVDSKNLNLLQVALKDKLMGKKFLLVLDDVWSENYAHWQILSNPLKSGAKGSTIIVTTRNNDVASTMRTVSTHCLKTLLEEDCWSIFAKHAFHDGNPNARPELEVIGRQIVKKCAGLPLAAKTMGGLLRSKEGVNEWEKILKSELWDSPIDKTEILPALKLSYKYLPYI